MPLTAPHKAPAVAAVSPHRSSAIPSFEAPHAATLQESLERLPLSGLVSLDSSVTSPSSAEMDAAMSPSEEDRTNKAAAAEPSPHTLAPVQATSWFGSFCSWLFGSKTASPPAGNQAVSFLDSSPPAAPATKLEDQDEVARAMTAKEALVEKIRPVSIGDAFSRMESEDGDEESNLRSLDHVMRIQAETPAAPSKPSPGMGADPVSNGASRASSFWLTMADEDGDIEDALSDNNKDLSRYQRLTRVQDAQVARAARRMQEQPVGVSPQRLLRRRRDPAPEAKAIHNVFSEMEQADSDEVDKIKRTPELRLALLQANHHHIVA